MGQIEDKLRKLITERYGSVKKFSDKVGLPYTTIASIFQRGISNAKVTNIIKITEELGIDINQLIDGKIVSIRQEEPLIENPEELLSNNFTTIAAHFDGKEFTEEEWKQIESFAEFVKSKRE